MGGDPEATRGYLFDLGNPLGSKPLGILSSLPGVGPRTQAIHGGSQGLVRLWAQGAQGHARRVEARQDILYGFHLVQRQRLRRQFGREQVPQGRHRAVVHQRGIAQVGRVVAAGDRLLQGHDHIRVEGVVLLAVHVLEKPALADGLAGQPGAARQRYLVLLKPGKVHALYAGGYATKSQVHYLTGQAHRLEQLGAAIRADRRYAHFGHDLQQALVDPLAVVLVAGTGLAQHLTVAYQLLQHAVSQVGVDRRGAKTQQAGNLVGVARTGGFNHDIGIHPQAAANQVMVHGARRQQAVDGQAVARNGAIGQHEYGKPVADRLLRFGHQVLDCLAQAFFRGVIGALELFHHEPRPVELHQGGIFAVGQYRRG